MAPGTGRTGEVAIQVDEVRPGKVAAPVLLEERTLAHPPAHVEDGWGADVGKPPRQFAGSDEEPGHGLTLAQMVASRPRRRAGWPQDATVSSPRAGGPNETPAAVPALSAWGRAAPPETYGPGHCATV